jgi:Ribbon-helix-helix protein, copG family
MKRTQLYLPQNLAKILRSESRRSGTSISELVRRAVGEKYGATRRRREAMLAFMGMWKDRADIRSSSAYVRKLRKGKRLRRFAP